MANVKKIQSPFFDGCAIVLLAMTAAPLLLVALSHVGASMRILA